MRRARSLGLVLLLAASATLNAASKERSTTLRQLGHGAYERQVLGEVFTIDREYRSMKGPWTRASVRLLDGDEEELLWIIGYRAVMVDADGVSEMPQDYMCHSNLDYDPVKHQEIFGARNLTSRLFTLSQGQLEIDFPDGFGLPVLSTEELNLTLQVLDLNFEGESIDVRHRVSVRFLRDKELSKKEKPQALFSKGVYGLKLLEGEDGHFGVEPGKGDEVQHGPGCLPGANAADDTYEDGLGRTFTGHWVVEPGREENHTLVTHILNLPFDTTVHYVAVHLHPFAQSIRLHDLTTGETVFESHADQFLGRVGLSRVESFSSAEGLPLYRTHDYELVSIYNNTSRAPQDSMAVLNLYMLDRAFEGPAAR